MSNRITRHPDSATLMSFAAGSLPEPLAAAAAAHVSMCGECRKDLRDMELIGSALLGATPAPTAHEGELAIPDRPQEPQAPERDPPSRRRTAHGLPAPIARRYGLTLDSIPWKRLGPGIWHHRLALSAGVKGDLRLIKLAAGRRLPEHGHGGSELTLVLEGAFGDETGKYLRGDIQDIDDQTEHRPVADKTEGCVCLIANDRGLRFKGLLGLVLRLFRGPRRGRGHRGVRTGAVSS
jgi:putative transcriptional regulator